MNQATRIIVKAIGELAGEAAGTYFDEWRSRWHFHNSFNWYREPKSVIEGNVVIKT